jgi:hypothetical protein
VIFKQRNRKHCQCMEHGLTKQQFQCTTRTSASSRFLLWLTQFCTTFNCWITSSSSSTSSSTANDFALSLDALALPVMLLFD